MTAEQVLEELPQTPANTTNLYDADAQQRQTFNATEGTATFETVHVLDPLSDDRFFAYDDDCETRIVDDSEAVSTERVEASAALWDDICADILGFDGEKPANWKEFIDPVAEKMPSINYFLVAAPVEAEAQARSGRSWNTHAEIVLECYFNFPNIARTKHFLRKKTIADGKQYEKLQKIPLGRGGKGLKQSTDLILPSQARGKAALYDAMKIKDAEGYAGRVPAWHKIAVIDFVFRSSLSSKK